MENSKLIEQVINELLQKTIDNKVPWDVINPNAIRWVKKSQNITTVVLQKAVMQTPGNSTLTENYVLSIQTQPAGINIQINTAVEQSMREIFSKLFIEAMKVANDKTAQILRDLLEGL